MEKDAKAVNSDLDAGIEKNLDAVLILNKMKDSVKYSVKNGVVTLTGDVISRRDAFGSWEIGEWRCRMCCRW